MHGSVLGKRCFVLDLDGTVYLGNRPVKGAVEFIRRRWDDCDFYFLSNNTSRGPAAYIKKLRSMGIPAEAGQLLSPTLPLAAYLRKSGIERAYLVGNRDYGAALAEAVPELRLGPEDAQAVILSYDTELTYEKLRISAHLLQKPETVYLATHPDPVCPDPAGPLPDVGSFIALYEKAVGRLPDRIFGKPDPAVLGPLPSLYPREAMVIAGDRLSTDKKLADNAGIDFILVLSGEAKEEDLLGEERLPWRMVRDLGELGEDGI
ncbi:MAG: HAD-IIA family hydrolase [Desulfovibrio sp.]|jgi:HAD superfamily hydrolase (TIGR01450 family)|nr:HAD-IIA family hydrolase [Desulfovibrio sp.]